MDERPRDEEARPEERTEEPERIEDLDVPGEQTEDVKGGAFKQGFPIKWQGAG